MATLHARNFPDDLYARLRAAAEEDGRSIGAEAAALLRGALVDREQRRQEMRRAMPQPPTFRQQFVARATQLVERSQHLCREVGSSEVTPAHVLLAMLEDPVLRPALERKGITEESLRSVLPTGPPRRGPAPLSSDARRMLEQALVQSLGL
jgi:plasmid stability protein